MILLVTVGTMYDVGLRYRVLNDEGNTPENKIMNGENEEVGEYLKSRKTTKLTINFDEEITISKLWSIKQHNGSLGKLHVS